MARLVVQQFVSADGSAASEDGEFTVFAGVEGDLAEFERSNARWLEGVEVGDRPSA